MFCEKVLKQLSEFIDEALDPAAALEVSRHLNSCESCKKEYESLLHIRLKLKSIPVVQPPIYLRNLVEIRMSARRESWRANLRNTLERRWSIIRTTEGIYYWTKALGAAMTTVCFLLIILAASPYYYYMNAGSNMSSDSITPEFRQQVVRDVLKKIGLQTNSQISIRRDPAIGGAYLQDFAQSVSHLSDDETVSFGLAVDPDGAAKMQTVIDYPSDKKALSSLNEKISTARCRPASKNGQTIPSHMVLTFSVMTVYN